MANTSSSHQRSPKAATAAASALSAMIALNMCPVQAFQPMFLVPSARMMHRSPAFSSPVLAPASAVKMDCTPWDLECYGVHPLAGNGGLQRRRLMQQRRPGSVFFAPESAFQDSSVQAPQQLVISDPTVVEDTADLYTMAFDLPQEVDQDGLEVSVSGRLLTVKSRTTREERTGPSVGWVTRSSRTDSVSRSFVLPEGLTASSATASLLSNGKAQVKFAKDKAVAGAAAGEPSEAAASAPSKTDSTASTNKTASSAEHLASSFTAPPSTAAATADGAATIDGNTPATAGTASATSATDAPSPAAERPSARPESSFEVLDQEFLEFAKAVCGEEMLDILRVPTQEELAERAEAAKEARAKREAERTEKVKAAQEARAKREAEYAERVKAAQEARAKREAEFAERVKAAQEVRAKRVVAMRRATMASDISRAEDGSSYVVTVALPEGTTRDNVKLTVNPDNSLRVTASAPATKGGPSVYKNVFLPKDALTSEISAKFEAEQSDEKEGSKEDGGVASGAEREGAVSGLEVTVGRAIPPQPKNIEIL